MNRKGQATTETVLLLPLFMFFVFFFAKIFALLILTQKMEIASFYAARRWQLESHRNVNFAGGGNGYGAGDGALEQDITQQVKDYLGFNNPDMKKFLSLKSVNMNINRTEVWQVVTLTATTGPLFSLGPIHPNNGFTLKVVKYVPNRDRPIQFILPGASQ